MENNTASEALVIEFAAKALAWGLEKYDAEKVAA